MLNRDLIDSTYEFVVDYFKKQNDINETIDFKTICKGACESTNISEEEFSEMLGSFYTDLLQDGRFVYLGNDKWNLKDRITLEVYKKNQNSLYDYDSSIQFAEEYDDDSLPSEMKDAENEVYEENDMETSRDAYESEDDEDSLDGEEENEIIRREITKKSSNDDEDDEI